MLEAQALAWRPLGATDAALDLALAVRVADSGRKRDGTVLAQQVAEALRPTARPASINSR